MVVIREANEKDIDQLVELNLLQTFGEEDIDDLSTYERWQQGLWWVDQDLLGWYNMCLHKANGAILVLEIDDVIVGELDYCLSYDKVGTFEGFRGHVIWLLIHPEYQRKGFAIQLLNHIISISEYPIWVEPEDKRSLQLYRKFGEEIFSISNWEISLESITDEIVDNRLDYDILELTHLDQLSSSYKLLLGRYYAPSYDIQQFLHSESVKEYMWGNTGIPDIFFFDEGDTRVYVVMTQYPRIWVDEGYSYEQLRKIIAAVTLYLFEFGFDQIFIQIYNNEPPLINILHSLNYTQTIPHDPVYQIT